MHHEIVSVIEVLQRKINLLINENSMDFATHLHVALVGFRKWGKSPLGQVIK
jgi:hypothetical protein